MATGIGAAEQTTSAEIVPFAQLWCEAVSSRADAPFLAFEASTGEVVSWTYAEFDAVVARTAGLLRAHGVGPASAVHLVLGNSPHFIALWLAANRLGAWIVPSDPRATVAELAEHINRTRPAFGACTSAQADEYGIVARESFVVVDEADVALTCLGDTAYEPPRAPGPKDRAAVMFTSGTTGAPKGVEITQANYTFAGQTMARASRLEAHHRALVVLPLFHANAQYYSVSAAVAAGASVALMHTFSASQFIQQAARHGATHASLFAAPIRMILARSDPPSTPLALEHCWFAMNLNDAEYGRVSNLLGVRPRQLYGMTETIAAVITDQAETPSHDVMGEPTLGCEVGLWTDEGVLPPGPGTGQLVVRGEPGVSLFAGYLDDEATTRASFRSGWFLTGDQAERDASGCYRFGGRRSDILKVSGENVSTVEIEQVLGRHDGVLDVAVIGTPDPIRDEVPVAYVVPADRDDPPSAEMLADWAAHHLSKSKRPHQYVFVDELPRTSVGKVRKHLLRPG